MSNIDTTKIIMESFRRGDIEHLLTHIADDVDWEYGSIVDVPWYRPRQGKEEAAGFFESLATSLDIFKWEPKIYLGAGDLTVVILDSDYSIKSTGRRVIYEDCVLVLRFNAEGKVARFAHRVDLHQAWLAYHYMEQGLGIGSAEVTTQV